MENIVKIVAIVQARMGSSRLPNKVLKKLLGKSVIEILLARLSQSKLINEIYVATQNIENDKLCDEINSLGYKFIRGSETDVLERFNMAAKATSADIIVRITGDCPIIDPKIVDSVIDLFLKHDVDYASNVDPPTFPDGLDVEVFTKHALEIAHLNANTSFDREHVTPYIRNGNFTKINLAYNENLSNLRFTLDEPEDLTRYLTYLNILALIYIFQQVKLLNT